MRPLPLIAGCIGVVVVIWEIPLMFTRTTLWPVLMLLAVAVVLLAVSQVRHGG